MNFFYKNYVPKIAIAVLFIGVGSVLSSCSKEKGNESTDPDNSKNTGQMQVQVLGITEEVASLADATSSVDSKPGVGQRNISAPKTMVFKGFDAVVSVKQDVLKQSNISVKGQKKELSAINALAASAPLALNVNYRLLLYKADGTFVSSTPLSSGTVGAVDVAKGTSYSWYAISYNSLDVVPDVNPANPVLALPGGKDVLYASGAFSIPASGPAGNVPLGITFQHKLARVALELNTMGMFANMTTAGVSVSGIALKTGSLNLKTGALTGLQNYTQAVNYNSFVDIDPLYQDAKVAYLYTADESAVNNLTITLNNLAITLDNTTTRSFATILAATPSVFTFSLTPQLGHSYRATVNLLESPLTIGTVRWGRANLYYQAGHNPYRFQHTYVPTNARNTYFSFKGLVPTQFGINSDPCAQVYPAGVWRQASEPDYRALVGTLGAGGRPVTYGNTGGIGFLEYTAAGTAAPYPSNNLHFNFNGQGISTGLVNGVIGLNLGTTYGTTAQLWTSSTGLNVLGLAGLAAWSYGAVHSAGIPPAIPAIDTDDLYASLLNVSAIGIDVVETNFKNVRCVRN